MQKVNNYSWRGSVPGGGFGHQGHADWYTLINPINNQAPGNPPEPSKFSTPYSGNLTIPKIKYQMNNTSRTKRGAPGRRSGRGITPGTSIAAGTQTEGMLPNDVAVTQTATSQNTSSGASANVTSTAPDQIANAQIADKSTDINTNEDNADTNDFEPYAEDSKVQDKPLPGPDDDENKNVTTASGSGTTFGENLYTGARNFLMGRPAPIIIPPTSSVNPNAPIPETFNSLSGQISPTTSIVDGRRGSTPNLVPASATSIDTSPGTSPGTTFKNSDLYRKVDSMRSTRANSQFRNDVLENPGKYASHSPRTIKDLEQIFKRPKTTSPTALYPESSGVSKRYFILI